MRATITYSPGPWLALVRNGHAVLLPPEAGQAEVERLWDALGEGPSVEALLSAVLQGHGLALTGLPPFALLALDEDLHVILRGPVSLAAHGRELGTHAAGTGVTTWVERRLARQETVTVAVDGVEDDGGARLPLLEGAVRFGRLEAVLPSACEGAEIEPLAAPAAAPQAEAPAPAPQPEAPAPVPEPEPPAAGAPPAEGDDAGAAEAPETTTEPVPGHGPTAPLRPAHRDAGTGTPAEAGDAAAPGEATEAGAVPAAEADSAATIGGAAESPESTLTSAEEAEDEHTILTPRRGTGGPEAAPPRAPGTAPDDGAPAAETGLIDAVPWLRAERQATSGQGQGPAPAGPAGDHDGTTVLRSDLPAGGPAPGAPGPAPSAPSPATGPQVLARTCPEGHANPPTASSCQRCGRGLGTETVQVRRPALGSMVVSSGERIPLDRSAVVGRQPSVARMPSGAMPRVVQVQSPSGDISRSHLEVRLEDWHVLLVDLDATNGTVLIRQGQAPRRLGRGESVLLLDGDIADLGDGVSLRFEDLP